MPDARLDDQLYRHDLNLLIGRTCNAACAHCSIESSPRNKRRMDADTVARAARLVRAFARSTGAERVVLTGGEPFLFRGQILALAHEARAAGLRVGVETNAFWAKSSAAAESILEAFPIDDFLLSTSLYHQQFVPWQRVLTAYRTARAGGRKAIVRIALDRRDLAAEGDMLRRARAHVPEAHLELQDVLPFGNRAGDAAAPVAAEAGGVDPLLCPADGMIVLDNGRVDPCCSSLNTLARHALVMGRINADPPDVLLRRVNADPVFEFLRREGVRPFLELLHARGSAGHIRALPANPCHACALIVGDPRLRRVIETLRQTPGGLDGRVPTPHAKGSSAA